MFHRVRMTTLMHVVKRFIRWCVQAAGPTYPTRPHPTPPCSVPVLQQFDLLIRTMV